MDDPVAMLSPKFHEFNVKKWQVWSFSSSSGILVNSAQR